MNIYITLFHKRTKVVVKFVYLGEQMRSEKLKKGLTCNNVKMSEIKTVKR